MPSSKELFKLDLTNKLILVRVDLNVPLVNGIIPVSYTHLRAHET